MYPDELKYQYQTSMDKSGVVSVKKQTDFFLTIDNFYKRHFSPWHHTTIKALLKTSHGFTATGGGFTLLCSVVQVIGTHGLHLYKPSRLKPYSKTAAIHNNTTSSSNAVFEAMQ